MGVLRCSAPVRVATRWRVPTLPCSSARAERAVALASTQKATMASSCQKYTEPLCEMLG